MTEETQISLLPSVDWRGVARASTLPLSYHQSRLLFFQTRQAYLGKAWSRSWKYCFYCHHSRWGPQSRMDPSLPKERSGGAGSEQAPVCVARGEPERSSPADTDRWWPWCCRAWGGGWIPSWSVGLYHNPRACVATCGPLGIGGSACLWHYYIFPFIYTMNILWFVSVKTLRPTKHSQTLFGNPFALSCALKLFKIK